MMDPEKLAKIRQAAEREDFNDPRVEAFYNADNETKAAKRRPFANIHSFFHADVVSDFGELDIALIGVPFDLGVTNRPGARHGPTEIRAASAMTNGPVHHHNKIMPIEVCRFADVGDVYFPLYVLDDGIAAIEAYYHKIMDAGVIPLSAGGDHSITYPILKALGREEPVGLVHIDAHCDTSGPYDGNKFHHGGPFRNAALDGVLDPERTIQIGIRGRAEPLWDFSYDTGMTVIHVEDYERMGSEAVVKEIHRVCGDGPTYISFDVDGIDPAFTPGTGTPEVGGLTPRNGQDIIRGCQGLNLIGGDVVEVAPPFDAAGNTSLVGANLMWEILCVLADSFDKCNNKD